MPNGVFNSNYTSYTNAFGKQVKLFRKIQPMDNRGIDWRYYLDTHKTVFEKSSNCRRIWNSILMGAMWVLPYVIGLSYVYFMHIYPDCVVC